MSEGSIPRPEEVTLLVFKDNFAARTFRIPLKWITRLGTLLILALSFILFSSYFTLQYFLIHKKGSVRQVQELEKELNLLKVQLMTPERPLEPQEKNAVTLTPGIVPASSIQETPPTLSNLFTLTPLPLQLVPPEPKTLPLSVKDLKANWEKNTLNVGFTLQYTQNDLGNQQGRILIFARGPGVLMTYPRDSLNPGDASYFLAPKKGELFSVSRFRDVKASFGPALQNTFKEVEILIFDKTGVKLLAYQTIKIPSQPTPTINPTTQHSTEQDTHEHSP